MAKPPNPGVYKLFGSWQIFQVMKYFQVVTNVAVTYKFSCWGRGRETAWRCLQNLQLLKNCFARLQIFVPAYKFLTCSRVVNRGCVPAPQVWCLQVLSLLTNFQTLYTVRHGPTHCTFFYFCFLIITTGAPRNWSLRAQVTDRGFYHSAMSTWGWSNFVHIYLIFHINLM